MCRVENEETMSSDKAASRMTAFHGRQEIKDKYLARVAAHRAADQMIHGVGWDNGKGCAVGCTLEAYDHARYESELGIPRMLAHLEDCIFEGLENGEAQAWPERFLAAIRPGADLSLVGWKFLAWLVPLTLERYATKDVAVASEATVSILASLSRGEEISASAARSAAEWSAASAASAAERSAARSAEFAASAARSVARSAEFAASAAWSAARPAAEWSAAEWSAASARSAEFAAWSAASAAWSAARPAAYKEMADKLINLLEAA